MGHFTSFLLHAFIPLAEALLHPRELTAILNTLVVCVLVACIVNGQRLVSRNGPSGLLIVWATGLGTILFWLLALMVLEGLGAL